MSNKTLSALLATAVAAAVLFTLKFGCPFLAVSGIPCPGCGMTRAFLAFFRLDFAQAFLYHPMFPVFLVLPMALMIYLAWRIRKHHRQELPFRWDDLKGASGDFFMTRTFLAFFCVGFAAYLAVYIYRVILPLCHLGDPTVLRLLISS
ncbi:MAG: DUF2752 domain-containing protein [Gracilibacteraceae bacterium]|jgi:hypothetical protein|nr:DUF2752 domain-containing protein [Gracilibacteraceae bacterium]